MKKTLVLASLLAAFGAASAQSSVTIGGATSFGYQRDKAAPSLTETDFSIVFKGTEQLGGGLSASFSTELDNGTSTSGFRSAVTRKNTSIALAGGFGVVTLASTRGSETGAMALVAPTNLSSDFYSSGVISRVAIDSLGYSMPMGALTLGVGYSESGAGVGNVANNIATAPALPTPSNGNNTTKTITLSARYVAGPLALAFAAKNSNASAAATLVTLKNKTNYELGATYDLGVAKLGVGFDSAPTYNTVVVLPAALPVVVPKSAILVGVSVPMGSNAIGLNYGKRDTATFTEVGFQSNLSARTNINASVGKYGAATKTNQYRVSLNHAF